ncbi:MAG TPA: hypothetical protein VGH83_02015 [Candidatus Acidoferrum sp.]
MPVAVRDRIVSTVSAAACISATCSVEPAPESAGSARSKAPAHGRAASVGASTISSRAAEVAATVSSTSTAATAKRATAVEAATPVESTATSTAAMKTAATAVPSAALRKRGIGR